jgi:hypothetical protein
MPGRGSISYWVKVCLIPNLRLGFILPKGGLPDCIARSGVNATESRARPVIFNRLSQIDKQGHDHRLKLHALARDRGNPQTQEVVARGERVSFAWRTKKQVTLKDLARASSTGLTRSDASSAMSDRTAP